MPTASLISPALTKTPILIRNTHSMILSSAPPTNSRTRQLHPSSATLARFTTRYSYTAEWALAKLI